MINMLHGLKDIDTVLSNHRKVGGAVEASVLRLASGETFQNPVITNIDKSKGQYVSLCFIDEEGTNIFAHIDQVAVIKGLEHKLICQLNNQSAKQVMLQDTFQYLSKLCKINDGFVTTTFKNEALRLVQDISIKEIQKRNFTLPFQVDDKLIHMKDRQYA